MKFFYMHSLKVLSRGKLLVIHERIFPRSQDLGGKLWEGAPIYVPEQYVTLIRQAKKNGKPYIVKEMGFDDFFDFKDLAKNMAIKEVFKKENDEVIHLTDMSIAKVIKDDPGQLLVKTSYKQSEFMRVDAVMRKNRRAITRTSAVPANLPTLKKAYSKKTGVNEKKKKGLLALFAKSKKGVAVMPQYYNNFFENL